MDQKTINLITLTLTNTVHKVEFLGEISEQFQIQRKLRQGHGLSPKLFNIVLDKAIKTLLENNDSCAIIGTKDQKIKINRPDFADELEFFAELEQE